MGNSYAGNFGSWFTATLGITTLDYAGLSTAQGLREKSSSRCELALLRVYSSSCRKWWLCNRFTYNRAMTMQVNSAQLTPVNLCV